MDKPWTALDPNIPKIADSRRGASGGWRSALLPPSSSPPLNMSQTHPSASSSSNFQPLFNAALDAYEKKTKCKLLTHPLAAQLQACHSPTAVSSVLQDIIQQFDRRRSSDQRLTDWLNPTVNVLSAFSDLIVQGVGLVSLDCLYS